MEWRCLECGLKIPRECPRCACGRRKPSAAEVVVATVATPPKTEARHRRQSSISRLSIAIAALVWGEEAEEEKVEVRAPTRCSRRREKGAAASREKRKRKYDIKARTSSAARLTFGQSARQRDVNNNTQSTLDALETLLDDKTGNSEVGANYLRRLVTPDLGGEEGLEGSARSAFEPGEVNRILLETTGKPPQDRTARDLAIVNHHLGWHPFFNVGRGNLKPRIIRSVTLVSPEQYGVVVLQGDLADAAFIVYSGKLAVHVKASPPKKTLKRKPLATEVSEYHREAEDKVGAKVATLEQGNAFGENGLDPRRGRRNATVVAICEGTHLFCIKRDDVVVPKKLLKSNRAATSFEGAPHDGLVDVLRTPAAERTEDQIDIVMHHCSWQPFFSTLEPTLASVACRHLRLLEFPGDRAVVLQGDVADCYFIVYDGQAEVYVSKDEKELHRWKGLSLWSNDPKNETVRLPLDIAGDKVFMLQQGMAFGESGLDPAGPKRRTATVVSAATRDTSLMLLALYREDVRVDPAPRPRQRSSFVSVLRAAKRARDKELVGGDEAPKYSQHRKVVLDRSNKRPPSRRKKKVDVARKIDEEINPSC